MTPATLALLLTLWTAPAALQGFRLGGRQFAGSPMPWEAFRRMSDADLGALYEFLRSLPPAPGPTGDPTFKKS
jgi:hypothetical protein